MVCLFAITAQFNGSVVNHRQLFHPPVLCSVVALLSGGPDGSCGSAGGNQQKLLQRWVDKIPHDYLWCTAGWTQST